MFANVLVFSAIIKNEKMSIGPGWEILFDFADLFTYTHIHNIGFLY